MKRHTLLLILLFLFVFENSIAQNTRFFVMSKLVMQGGDTRPIQGAVAYFVTKLDNQMKIVYPCAIITTESNVGVLLAYERSRQLLGSGNEGTMESICKALDYDFLISLNISTTASQFIVLASVIPKQIKDKVGGPVVVASATGQFSSTSSSAFGNGLLKACDDVAQKVVDGLQHVEVCPFKGEVKIRAVTEYQKDTIEEYPVYCNESDQRYKKRLIEKKFADNNWDLKKIGKVYSEGTVKVDLMEEKTFIEEDGCHKCISGRTGGRTYTEKHSKQGTVNGLSNESQKEGQPINDARITLKFNEDDTYLIYVEATTQKGFVNETTEKHAEGTCDILSQPTKTVKQQEDVPLVFKFGPYHGTSKDKILKEKLDPIIIIDPISGEKITRYLEFDLRRN